MKRNLYFYFILGLLITLSQCAYSQVFSLVNSPVSKLNYAVVNDQYGFAMVGGTNQFKSIDQGQTWTQLNSASGSPLYFFEAQNIAISSASTMCLVGFSAFTGTYTIVRTTDGGTSWTQVLSTPNSEPLRDLAANGNTLIATGVNGIYRSTDAGLNWTFTSLSSGGESSPFVRYNTASSSWLIGGYQSYFQYSLNNGVSWQNLGLNFSPDANIVAESVTANGLLIARKTSTTTQMLLLNATNTIDTNAIIESDLVMNGTPCLTGAFFNGNLLTHNQSLFYRVDPTTNNVYHFGFPAPGGSYLAEEISLGTNYGVAITSTASGSGRIYRIDLTQNPNLYVPSYFTIQGPGPCAGDPIIATASADYADSLKWYVNNIAVSTANTLNYPTSAGIYMTYNVKLVTYYNGVSNTTTKPVVMTAPAAPHGYTYSLDVTACYGLPLSVLIDPNPSTPFNNTLIKMLYNGQLVYGPVVMNVSNINVNTTPLTTSGTLQIITYKVAYCDPSADTVNIPITVGPNLFDFSILPHDSVICTGINPVLDLTGTNSLYNYEFYPTYSYLSPTVNSSITPGNSAGILSVTQMGADSYIDESTNPDTYGNMYMYVNLKITDQAGCTPEKIIDTIRIQRRTAFFELHSHSYLSGDTVGISNAYIRPNRLWSSLELNPAFIANETDTIPQIIADTTGFFGIELRTEPLAGCADSMINYVHYADPAPLFESVCESKKVREKVDHHLHHTRIDQFGNIYEVWVFQGMYHYPYYILRKNDPSGNFLWEKKVSNSTVILTWYNGIVIEDIDFDSEGNPVLAMWIQGDHDFQDEYINYQYDNGAQAHVGCFIVKADKTDGSLIWSVNLGEAAPSVDLDLYQGVRITDVVVDGDLVHATTYASYELNFFTLNSLDGSLVNTTPFEFGAWSNTPFIAPGFFFPYGSNGSSEQSFWSPQIDVLSTGEVVAIGHYQNVPLNDYPQLTMTNSNSGIFIMKYHPDHGVYDIENIAQTGANEFAVSSDVGSSGVPKMVIDKNDNITVVSDWEYLQGPVWGWGYPPLTIKVLDSVIPMSSGTFVLNMDRDYNMNWLSVGTHGKIQDLAYSPASNETFIAVRSKDNFSMGNNEEHLMMGESQDYDMEYTSIPLHDLNLLDYPQKHLFITKLNTAGEPVEMKELAYDVLFDNMENRLYMRMAATSCGDLAIYTWGVNNTQNLFVDGQTFPTDSVMLFLQYSNCVSDDCSYLEVKDSMEICSVNGVINGQFRDYYNLNSFTYDILFGGTTVVSGQTASALNGHFSIPSPATNGTFTISFTSPNFDMTTVVVNDLTIDFGTLSDDTLCIYSSGITLGNNAIPAGGTYSGTGVNGSQFIPSFAGQGLHELTYTYTNQMGCTGSDSLVIFVDACAGIETLNPSLFLIFPNPFSNELNLKYSGGTMLPESRVIIYDQIGRIVLNQSLDEINTKIRFDFLSKGNYTLEIVQAGTCVHREQIVKM
ncbi:T9SS type A sorting domain-containing protein [Fluviicola taffensis]|uniref:T9SS type A sorting domain-containing protein n=1 Tax=Fluviicola taffensis TaxID=191579 RepID=UPI00313831E2